jgi:hypothetical protein
VAGTLTWQVAGNEVITAATCDPLYQRSIRKAARHGSRFAPGIDEAVG